jgi:hypothetical protein
MKLAMICAGLLALEAQESTESAQPEPRIGIEFNGWLPGSVDPALEGTFRVDFRIYKSPQGGEAIWREVQEVRVEKGEMRVVLGAVEKIPLSIHEATFKFLGAAVDGNPEIYPRFPIVNVVYVSPKEALVAVTGEAVEKRAYARPEVRVSGETEEARTWLAAYRAARAAGGDLPSYVDWYEDLGRCTAESVLERAGHYEWVQPWVYDTASHGLYNRYFRGRFQGCDYMDLSPEKSYVYRIARALPEK